jgi:hypothetical protein
MIEIFISGQGRSFESRYSLSQAVQYDSRVVLLIAEVAAGR